MREKAKGVIMDLGHEKWVKYITENLNHIIKDFTDICYALAELSDPLIHVCL